MTHFAEDGTVEAVRAASMSAAISLDESADTLAITAWKALLVAIEDTSAWKCEGCVALA